MRRLFVLTIGDVHIKTNSLNLTELLVDKVCTFVSENRVDLIVLLGDILDEHEKIHTDAYNCALKAVERLSNLGPPLVVLIGNHDLINNQQFLTDRHGFNALKKWSNVTIVDTVVSMTIKKHLLYFVPYVPPGRFEEALNTSGDSWKQASVIFAHQEFQGCKMGSIISKEGDIWPSEYPLVVSGHIHDYQKLGNVIYTGTPMQHSFGDSAKKTVGYFTFSDTYEYTKIDLGMPKKKTFNFTLPDVNVSKILKYVTGDNKVKVVLNGKKAAFDTFKKTEEYGQLLDLKVMIHFKAEREKKAVVENEGEGDEETTSFENVYQVGEKNFLQLLQQLVVSDAGREALDEVLKELK